MEKINLVRIFAFKIFRYIFEIIVIFIDKIFLIYLRFKFNLESCIFILKFNNPNQREFHASLYFLSIQITCNRSTGNSIIAELRLSDVVAVV